MNDSRLHSFLCRFADVRESETRAAMYFFLFFFLITFPAYIIKPVKDNLLIDMVRPGWWAYADLITAVLIGFVVALNARLLSRLSRRHYMSSVIFMFIATLFFFWFIFDFQTRSLAQTPLISSSGFLYFGPVWYVIQLVWPFPVILFAFWADVFIATSVTQFWIAVNDIFYPYQTKRMVGLFVSGGLLGGICGALTTSILVRIVGQTSLLFVCLGGFLVTIMVVNLIYAEQKKLRETTSREGLATGVKVGYLESLKIVRQNRYLRILAGILASAMIVGALINFQFKIVLKAAIENSDSRASFIAAFFLIVLLVSSIFHIITTDRVLKNFGIRLGLMIAPLVLLIGALSSLAIPAAGFLLWACFMRGSDKIFDNTTSQSVRELLYIPVPADIKYKAKMFIDMFVSKFATGFGAVLFLALYHIFRFKETVDFDPQTAYSDIGALLRQVSGPVKVIGVPIVVFIGLWFFLIRVVYREYVGTVGMDLRRIWEDAHVVVEKNVDEDVTRLFMDTIQSQGISETLYAMNVFDLVQKEKLSPELKSILTCKADEIKARSIDSLLDAGCEIFIPEFGEILADSEFKTQIEEIFELDSYKEVMGKHLEDIIQGSRGTEVERMEAAKLTGQMAPTSAVLNSLKSLLRDDSAEVLNYALSSAAVHRREEFIPLIIPHLANPVTRQVAQIALAAYNPSVVDLLSRILQSDEEDIRIRAAIPEILAKFGTQKAAETLLAALPGGPGELEQELVDCLYKIKSSQPYIAFEEKMVLGQVLSMIRQGYALYLDKPGSAQGEPERRDLKNRLDRKIKRIFDLLSLVYPSEDIVKACQNIFQGTKASIDYSLELLDNILDRDFKAFLFPLVEELPYEEKVRRLKKMKKALDGKSL